MGTLQPCSTWRTGNPARTSAASKLKLHPSSTVTRSSLHHEVASVAESGVGTVDEQAIPGHIGAQVAARCREHGLGALLHHLHDGARLGIPRRERQEIRGHRPGQHHEVGLHASRGQLRGGPGVLPSPYREPRPLSRNRSARVASLIAAVFEDLGQGVQQRAPCPLCSFVRAESIVHQAALSTSGYTRTWSEPGGHSSSKVLLTACVAAKSPSSAHALIRLRLDWPNSPRKSLDPSGGGDPNSSSNSRSATVSA